MKSLLMRFSMLALGLYPALAISTFEAQATQYTITDLGPANNPFSQATSVNNFGMATGVATATDGSQHAVYWLFGQMSDLGSLVWAALTARRAP